MPDNRLFLCSICGLVRESDQAPVCRHGDPQTPAAQMKDLPSSHPLAGKTSAEPGFHWLRASQPRCELAHDEAE